MTPIEEIFSDYFSRWEIRLPEEAVRSRIRGEIQSHGWYIQYLFDKDEQGEFLDFYASHRMTNDRHVRIYASGEIVLLPAYRDFMIFPVDASEMEKQRIKEENHIHNRQVSELLKVKGFK